MTDTEYLNGIYDENVQFLSELTEKKRWAAKRWLDHCWSEEVYFRITEAYRSQERQNNLYRIGRRGVKGEKPVTWTKHSLHTQRIAVDVVPLAGYGDREAFDKIEEIAKLYSITHPIAQDLPHFQFEKAQEPIPPLTVLLRMTLRELRTATGSLFRMLTRRKKRIEKRLTNEEE